MSLMVWLPLDGNLENFGASAASFTGTPTYSTGKIGQCLSNGTITSTNTTLPVTLTTAQEYSMCSWVKMTSINTWIWNMGTGTSTTRGLWIGGANQGPHFAYSGSGAFTGSTVINDGKWHHVCFTVKGTVSRAYVDGVDCGGSTSTRTDVAGDNGIRLYATSICSINDFRLYSHCLSAAEVHEIAQGLVLHYKLDTIGKGNFGNPNLAIGTNTASTSTNTWGISMQVGDKTNTIEYDGNIPVVAITRGSTEQSGWYYLYYSNINRNAIKVSTTYTIAFDVKASVNGSIGLTGLLNGNATNYMTNNTTTIQNTVTANQWCHIVFQCRTKDSFSDITVGGQVIYMSTSGSLHATGVKMSFKNLKLEEGTVETAWCPATSEVAIDYSGIQDSSGYNRNGTITGTLSLTSDTPRYSQCMEFHANTTDYITIPTITLDMTNVTFSAWAKWKTFNTWSRVFDFGEKASGAGYSFLVANSGSNLVVAGRRSGGASLPDTTIMTIDTNTWYHICVTIVDTTCKTYVNGELKKTFTLNGSIGNALYNLNYLGKSNWSADGKYDGYISDFHIYCTALSAEDVKALYEVGAKVDNKGNWHTYEFVESGLITQITKTGITRTNEVYDDKKFNHTAQIIKSNSAVLISGNLDIVTTKSTSTKVGGMSSLPGSILLTLKGKTLRFSYEVNASGARYSAEQGQTAWSYTRYGIHGAVSVDGSTNYPFADNLNYSGADKRVEMTWTVPNASSFGDLGFSIQNFDKPASTNNNTWYIRNPKLEVLDGTSEEVSATNLIEF